MKPANRNLVSLKLLLFCFFGGVGCLFPILPKHMLAVGLTHEEAHIVSIVAPLIALLGPLFAGPLADKLGSASSRNNGGALRVMLAVATIASAISYLLLLAIPTVTRFEPRRPAVSFTCGTHGAEVLQERCMEQSLCYHWAEEKVGPLHLTDCHYDCQPDGVGASPLEGDGAMETTTLDYLDVTSSGDDPIEPDMEAEDEGGSRKRRHAISQPDLPQPHLCFNNSKGVVSCHVYTYFSKVIAVDASLLQATNPSASRHEWCRYPLGGEVSCRIPPSLLAEMDHEVCRIVCSLDEPYTIPGSVLAESQCQRSLGDPAVTFWTYLLVRSIADVFPSAAVALLYTAIIIATRETSFGHSDFGRQLAFGSLGFALFAPIIHFLIHGLELISPPESSENPVFLYSFIVFAVLMAISALVVLFAKSMPLGAPEWWWAARGSVGPAGKKWGAELAALLSVLVLLGALFSALDSYLPWHLSQLQSPSFLEGFVLTAGALPAIPLLWYSEKVIDYCGHSNLLIMAFTFYIVRYTGLSFFTDPWWTLACEPLEMFTLSLMWVTAVLYVRHLVPRHLTASGQAAAVAAHFCLGRCLGALLTGIINQWSDSLVVIYRVGAIAAAVIASIYFILYHCCLKPRCLAPTSSAARRQQTPVVRGGAPPTNGSYTPLRVYKNGGEDTNKGGQFRY